MEQKTVGHEAEQAEDYIEKIERARTQLGSHREDDQKGEKHSGRSVQGGGHGEGAKRNDRQ